MESQSAQRLVVPPYSQYYCRSRWLAYGLAKSRRTSVVALRTYFWGERAYATVDDLLRWPDVGGCCVYVCHCVGLYECFAGGDGVCYVDVMQCHELW